MSKYYYMNEKGVQSGPIDESEFIKYGIKPTTLVWTRGMKNWQPAQNIIKTSPQPQPRPQPQPKPKQSKKRSFNFLSDNIKTFSLIQMGLCIVLFLPLSLLFQWLALNNSEIQLDISKAHGIGKLLCFFMNYWPVIAVIASLILAVIAFFEADEQPLQLSIIIAVAMVILGAIMIFNPGLAVFIVMIVAIGLFFLAYNS